MESREIVLKRIEIGSRPQPSAGGASGAGPGPTLGRAIVRVLLVILAVALIVPAVVLGGACIVTLLVFAILRVAIRRIAGK